MLGAGAMQVTGGERYQVVVHVAEQSLREGDAGRSEVEEGPWLAVDTVRRLACDASIVEITEDEEGNPLDIGRKRRSIPPALRRALRSRDKGCRFPGCTHRRFVDAHHIEHWAEGGATKLDNLALLCGFHHRLVHEGGFGLSVGDKGALVFTRPDGRPIEAGSSSDGDPDAIRLANERLGLHIHARTCVPNWDGLPMDYHMAMDSLLQRDGCLH